MRCGAPGSHSAPPADGQAPPLQPLAAEWRTTQPVGEVGTMAAEARVLGLHDPGR